MKSQKFQQVLDEIAAKAVPDSMSIREAVMSQLRQDDKPKRKRQPRNLRRWLLRIAAVVALLIGFGLVYRMNQQPDDFVPQQSFSGDNGIFKAASARLVKQLNLTKEPVKEDVSVTLVWAYADGNRIALEYEFNYDDSLSLRHIDTATLVDRDTGQSFATLPYNTAGTGQSNSRRYSGETRSFDASGITNNPAKLNLRLTLDFSGSRGSTRQMVEPFEVTFEFDVPFIPAVPLAETYTAGVSEGFEQTAELARGVTMTLSDIVYAPSMTRARLCYNVPDKKPWEPGLTNMLEDSPVIEAYFRLDEGEKPDDGMLCGSLDVMATWNSRSEKYTIEIESLVNNTGYRRDRLAAFEMALRQQGIVASVKLNPEKKGVSNLSYWYGPVEVIVEELLPGMNFSLLEQTIAETGAAMFGEAMMGPWRFEFDTPPIRSRSR